MATYVLVHGGGHGGWCYDKVASLLRQAGHDVHAPTLTGLGERSHLVSAEIDLELHIGDVVNTLRYQDLKDVILVGHSYGGMVITGVADRAGDRIARLVYLDASRPQHGQSLALVTPAIMGAVHDAMRVVDGVELVLWPEENSPQTYGVTAPDDIAWMAERLTPQPWKTFTQPIAIHDPEALERIPRASINCTETMQRRPADSAARALDAEPVWEIDTGHDLMITEPQAVTDMLLSLAW